MVRRALEPMDYPFLDYRRFTFSLGIAAAGQVWLSGSTAVRFDKERKAMVVEGDLIAQAGVIYDKMRKTLAAASLTLADVTRLVQYVTPPALPDLARLDEFRRAAFGEAAPIVSTIVVKSLLRETALIEVEATASAGGSRTAVVVASVAGDPAAGNVTGQCRKAYAELAGLLKDGGADLDSVVKTTEFIVPAALADYRHTADVRREVFSTPYPAATGVICERLARPGGQILVEAITLRAA
jgi:enamine deaminase RidA (YjgF/YER057c/UK114 family)